jgi:cytochrome c-type biogenesis protein CcsB
MNNIWLTIEQSCNNLGFGALLITLLMYLIEFNFSNNFNDSDGLTTPILIKSDSNFTQTQLKKQSLANTAMVISNLIIALGLGARWIAAQHFPLSNLYESLLFLSWTMTFIHLGLSNYNFKWLGMITTPTALMFNGFASFSLPEEMQLAGPLVPALQSNWLMMHVTLMIISYGTLILGSLIAMIFLVVNEFVNYPVSPEDILSENYQSAQKNEEKSITEALDNVSYRLVGLGFPLLTIGIISGAVWANEAWGSYWSWDPKETWALITWLNFAIYLHTRLNKGWQGKKAAYVATIGFILIWVCYLGVNLLGKGLHSYGFFQ